MTFSALDSDLFGPLFATDAMRAVFTDEARLAAMLQTEAALARAQAQLGLVPAELGDAIDAVGAANLDAEKIGRQTAQAIVTTVPFVKAVHALLPNSMQPHFHLGSTAQDIMDTALVLQMRRAFELIEHDMASVIVALTGLAHRHRLVPCAGRTYGQHAAAITFGYKASIWCAGVADAASGLLALRQRVLMASCGGPAGTLTTFGKQGPRMAALVAKELGLVAAPMPWHVRRACIVETASWLTTLMGALAKMATDISYLISTDISEAAEPHVAGRGGSSSMPHKRNPLSVTVVLAAFSAARGYASALWDSMIAAHERPAGNWQAEWLSLPQLFGLASGALRESLVLAEGLEVYPARMLVNLQATKGLLFADVAASRLAPLIGRETAHDMVNHAADQVRIGNRTLKQVLLEDAAGGNAEMAAAIEQAFELDSAVEAASVWTDAGLDYASGVLAGLARR
jgi:3-carboxy-cis,cis-muconate cycloisomerase